MVSAKTGLQPVSQTIFGPSEMWAHFSVQTGSLSLFVLTFQFCKQTDSPRSHSLFDLENLSSNWKIYKSACTPFSDFSHLVFSYLRVILIPDRPKTFYFLIYPVSHYSNISFSLSHPSLSLSPSSQASDLQNKLNELFSKLTNVKEMRSTLDGSKFPDPSNLNNWSEVIMNNII